MGVSTVSLKTNSSGVQQRISVFLGFSDFKPVNAFISRPLPFWKFIAIFRRVGKIAKSDY